MRGGWFGDDGAELEAAVDVALIALLASGDGLAWDRLARVLGETPAFSRVDWDELPARAELLRADAPLFSEVRERITGQLRRSSLGGPAVRAANRLLGEDPADEAASLVADVASRLGIAAAVCPRAEGLPRARFDDPNDPTDLPLHAALARADVAERGLLLAKLQTARAVLAALGDGARVEALGRRIPSGAALLQADAVVKADDGVRHLVRLLGPGEALHPGEAARWIELAERPPRGFLVVVAHVGRPWPPDRGFLEAPPEDGPRVLALPSHGFWPSGVSRGPTGG